VSPEELHSLLQRQIQQHLGSIAIDPGTLRALLDAVSATYRAFDADLLRAKERAERMRRAVEAAQESSRATRAILDDIGHKLRTPLNAILGYCEMLEEERAKALGEEGLQDLRRIHLAGRQLLEGVNGVLDRAKKEAP
jgi:signal transduction histidine kinase